MAKADKHLIEILDQLHGIALDYLTTHAVQIFPTSMKLSLTSHNHAEIEDDRLKQVEQHPLINGSLQQVFILK